MALTKARLLKHGFPVHGITIDAKIITKLIPQTIFWCKGGHYAKYINSPGNVFV